MEKDLKFLAAITLVIAVVEVYYLFLMGSVGPFYDKPFEAKLTYFDTGIFDGQKACFQVQLTSLENEARKVTASLDGAEFSSQVLSQGRHNYCVDAAQGNHTIEISIDTSKANSTILNESYLRFGFVKSNSAPGTALPSSFSIAENGSDVKLGFFNGEYRERVYLLDFGTDSSYVKLGPLQNASFEKTAPEKDIMASINGFSRSVKGTGNSFGLAPFILGIALMFVTGFSIFYNRTLEGILKAVLFSYVSLIFISLVLNNFLGSITFAGMAVGTVLMAVAGIFFKKQIVRLIK